MCSLSLKLLIKTGFFGMKESMVVLFLLFLVLGGCKDSSLNVTEEFVPGEVSVKFTESVKKEEAKTFIEDLNLNAIDLSDLDNEAHPNWTLIGVPEGKEKFWVKKFSDYSIVQIAELNGIVHAQ